MDKQKVVIVLLIIAILFSVATVYSLYSLDPESCRPVTNRITNVFRGDPDDSGRGVVGFNLVAPPGGA